MMEPVAPETFTPGRFAGQVMLVTGAGGGMGLACATRAAREGASVVLCDLNGESVRAAAATINADGGKALGVACDVTSRADMTNAVRSAVERFGGLDAAINNAGVMDGGKDGRPAPMHLANETYLRRTIEVNLFGTMMSCAAELECMVAQGRGGSIVNVGSTTGLTGSAGTPAYVASKHAISGLTRSVAIDYAPYGIRCNSVNMASTQTPMLESAMAFVQEKKEAQPDGSLRAITKSTGLITRISTVWEQAAVILFVGSREASNMTGALVASDGGWTAY